jgi:hypothetical protein
VNVRGSAVSARIQWVKERGVADYARLLNELSPDTRREIERGLNARSWVPFSLFVEVVEVIDRVFGAGDLALCVPLGRYACDVNLRALYRFLFKVGNVHFIIRRAASAWRIHYDEGELRVVEEGPSHVIVRILDWPEPHRAHCLSVKGWVIEAGHISGTEMKTSQDKCRVLGDDVCEMRFDW